MGQVGVKVKVMPESPDTDLEAIKTGAKTEVEAQEGILNNYVEEPIAFGLKALIATITLPEDKDTEILEEIFKKQPGVQSVEIIDYRRLL